MTLNNQELLARFSWLRDQLEAQTARGLDMAGEIAELLKDGQAWMEAAENLRLATVDISQKLNRLQKEIYELLRERMGPDDAPDWEQQ